MAESSSTLTGMTVADKIRNRREELGLTQAELAAEAGLVQSRVAKWEIGEGKPNTDHLKALARALKVTAEYLCDPDASAPQGHRELSEDERFLARLVDRIGVQGAIDRLLDIGENEKRADPASEEKPSPPVESKPNYARPVTPGRLVPKSKKRSSE